MRAFSRLPDLRSVARNVAARIRKLFAIDNIDDQQHSPLFESNLLWGAGALAIGIILTVVAATKQDLRWLLFIAWPFASLAGWRIFKPIASTIVEISLTVLWGLIVALGLYRLDIWLEPQATKIEQPIPRFPSPAEIASEVAKQFPKSPLDREKSGLKEEFVYKVLPKDEHKPEKSSDKPTKSISKTADDSIELKRRRDILERLSREYILSHDGISPGVIAGTEQPPDTWINQRLKELREGWTVAENKKEKPDIGLRLVYPKLPALLITNLSNIAANVPKYSVILWNLDSEGRDPLPIPVKVATGDYVSPRAGWGPTTF